MPVLRSLVHVGPAFTSLLFLSLVFLWVSFLGMSQNGDPLGDLVLREFPGLGCPVLCPFELTIVFGLYCTGAVKYVAVPWCWER